MVRKGLVLIVEDDDVQRRLFEYTIGKICRVRVARDGREAMDIITSEMPDVIISDVMMPVMDGFELHKNLQDKVRTKMIPFIFLSALDDEAAVERALRSGVDEYMIKPVEIDMLIIRTIRLLERIAYYKGEMADHDKLRVFMCYASEDKSKVQNVYGKLVVQGVKPWLDSVDLLPGHAWEEEIKKAIKYSHVVLAFMSKKSVGKSGFIQKEIKYALDVAIEQPSGGIFIIPVKLEPCDVPKQLEVWQWVQLYKKSGFNSLVNALCERANVLHIPMIPRHNH